MLLAVRFSLMQVNSPMQSASANLFPSNDSAQVFVRPPIQVKAGRGSGDAPPVRAAVKACVHGDDFRLFPRPGYSRPTTFPNETLVLIIFYPSGLGLPWSDYLNPLGLPPECRDPRPTARRWIGYERSLVLIVPISVTWPLQTCQGAFARGSPVGLPPSSRPRGPRPRQGASVTPLTAEACLLPPAAATTQSPPGWMGSP